MSIGNCLIWIDSPPTISSIFTKAVKAIEFSLGSSAHFGYMVMTSVITICFFVLACQQGFVVCSDFVDQNY